MSVFRAETITFVISNRQKYKNGSINSQKVRKLEAFKNT